MNAEQINLTDEEVSYYRQALVDHALDPRLGVCRLCHVLRCAPWVTAFDKLAVAKQLMRPPDWRPQPTETSAVASFRFREPG